MQTGREQRLQGVFCKTSRPFRSSASFFETYLKEPLSNPKIVSVPIDLRPYFLNKQLSVYAHCHQHEYITTGLMRALDVPGIPGDQGQKHPPPPPLKRQNPVHSSNHCTIFFHGK